MHSLKSYGVRIVSIEMKTGEGYLLDGCRAWMCELVATGIAEAQREVDRMRLIDADALIQKMNLAIAVLKRTMKNFDIEDDPELQMELKAYKDIRDGIKDEPTIEPEPQWIPCSERLPEENIPVLLGVKFKDDFKCFVSARIDYNYWTGLGREIRGEMRWMPLPEPYNGGEK